MKVNDKVVIEHEGFFDFYEVVDYNNDNDFSLYPIFFDTNTNVFSKYDLNETIHCYLGKYNYVYRRNVRQCYAYRGVLLFAGDEKEVIEWVSKNKELPYVD